jgi:hypothetical protein
MRGSALTSFGTSFAMMPGTSFAMMLGDLR